MPSPEDLSNPGIEPGYPTLQADFLPTELSGKPSLCRHSILSNTKQIRVGVCTHVHICSVMSDSFQPQGLYPARLLCPWGFSRQEYWSGLLYSSPGDLPNPGIKPRSPTLQVDSLLSEQPGKPRSTGRGSLSLLQRIFPIQESNWGLLLYRQILYQLRYQGSPIEHLPSARPCCMHFILVYNLNLAAQTVLSPLPWTVSASSVFECSVNARLFLLHISIIQSWFWFQ